MCIYTKVYSFGFQLLNPLSHLSYIYRLFKQQSIKVMIERRNGNYNRIYCEKPNHSQTIKYRLEYYSYITINFGLLSLCKVVLNSMDWYEKLVSNTLCLHLNLA